VEVATYSIRIDFTHAENEVVKTRSKVHSVEMHIRSVLLGRNPNLTLTLEPKINRLRQTAEDYFSAEFQVIPIRGFRSVMLTYILAHSHTHAMYSFHHVMSARQHRCKFCGLIMKIEGIPCGTLRTLFAEFALFAA